MDRPGCLRLCIVASKTWGVFLKESFVFQRTEISFRRLPTVRQLLKNEHCSNRFARYSFLELECDINTHWQHQQLQHQLCQNNISYHGDKKGWRFQQQWS